MKKLIYAVAALAIGNLHAFGEEGALSKPQTRDEAWAEATRHQDKMVTEYHDGTLITETIDGALTLYYFSKPPNPGYPNWFRDKIYPRDGESFTYSYELSTRGKDWPHPDTRPFEEAFHKLTSYQ